MKNLILFISIFVNIFGVLHAETLITQQEAKLSPAANTHSTRGISRGPAVIILSPNMTNGHLKSPFDLKIQFESRGGNKIDLSQVKVTYLKSPEVDFSQAEVPQGEHAIKILIKDKDGRETATVFNFTVAK